MAPDPEAVRRCIVVLIRLPRDEARPAVVGRSDLLSELSCATVLPITTALRVGISMRIDIAPSQENGLRAASQVMVDWPQTVRFSDIDQAIGQLDAATMRVITQQIAVVLRIGAGVLMIALGIYAMVRPNLLMPVKRETLQIAGQKVVMETRRIVAIPRPLSGLIIVSGGGLILLGIAKRRM